MKIYILLIPLFLLSFIETQGQTYRVRGIVCELQNNQKIGIPNVMVTCNFFKTRTDQSGTFLLELESSSPSVDIKIDNQSCFEKVKKVDLTTPSFVEFICNSNKNINKNDEADLLKKQLESVAKERDYSTKRMNLLKDTLQILQIIFDQNTSKINDLENELGSILDQLEREKKQHELDALKAANKEFDLKEKISDLTIALDGKQHKLYENFSDIVSDYCLRLKDYLDVLENVSYYVKNPNSEASKEFVEKQELYEEAYKKVDLKLEGSIAKLNEFWDNENSLEKAIKLKNHILSEVHQPIRKKYKQDIIFAIFDKNITGKKGSKKCLTAALEIKDFMEPKVSALEIKIRDVLDELKTELPQKVSR